MRWYGSLRRWSMIDCTDFVITHIVKPIQEDDLYKTLCVGGLRMPDKLCELDGENIAEYNDRINELTGLYWIWKNTDCEHVGLSHYRRFFNDGGRLGKDRIEKIMGDYDIILSEIRLEWTILHNIRLASGAHTAMFAYNVFQDVIREKQPEYLDAFEDVMANNKMYRCNMFVTRREILDRFCEWLFSFLLDATDCVDVRNMGFYERRVCGYFGEAMWTVWLRKNGLRVYDMPIGG